MMMLLNTNKTYLPMSQVLVLVNLFTAITVNQLLLEKITHGRVCLNNQL